MTVYTISVYNTSTGINDGVWWVVSSKEKALDLVESSMRINCETKTDIENDICTTIIYTTQRTYSIEQFALDDY